MPNFSQLEEFFEEYFPNQITASAREKFRIAFDGYVEWNAKINVISRKDVENLAERHFLHSLAIAKRIEFTAGTRVLDAGTGGGFPGIPLAIMFPETQFHLVDSRSKKITVVQEIAQSCGLDNVQISVQRVEELDEEYDFVVSRAVAAMEKFIPWVREKIHCRNKNTLPNGILYLRGGEIAEEMRQLKIPQKRWSVTPIADFFHEEFFETKAILHLSFC